MYANSYVPLIKQPTRVTNNTKTLIDNIYTNCITDHHIESGIFYTDISDHFPIFCIIKTEKREKSTDEFIHKRIYSSNKYRDMISSENWVNSVLSSNDPQDAFSSFHSTLCKFHNICFPLQKIKLGYKTKKTWLTQELKTLIIMKK